jgi:hypothetical protein
MAGLKALKKIQLGQEAVAGTEVAATTVWRGSGNLRDDRNLQFVDEDIGVFAGSDRTYTSSYFATLLMESTPASYQQIGYILNAGINIDVAGSADGGGTDYIYTHTVPTTGLPTIKTFTIEGGDNQQEEQVLYGFVQDFTIEGSGGEALMVSANWGGRQQQTGTFTGSVAIPTLETILFSKGKLYIDASGGTHGSTQVADTLLAATLNVNTGIIPKYTADGSLDFSFIQYTMPEITLDVTFEHNASAVAEKAAWRAETVRLIQLKFEGSAFGTGGTTYSNHTFIVDLVGKWESFAELGDQDGNTIVTGTFRNRYNSTDGAGQFVVVNELATLT